MPLHLDAYGPVFVVSQRAAGLLVTQVWRDGIAAPAVVGSRITTQAMRSAG